MEETLRAAHSHFPRHVARAEVQLVHRFDYGRLSCSAVVRHHLRFPAVVVFVSRRAPVAAINGATGVTNAAGFESRELIAVGPEKIGS